MDKLEPTPPPHPLSDRILELKALFSDDQIMEVVTDRTERWSLRALSQHPTLQHDKLADYIARQVTSESVPETVNTVTPATGILLDDNPEMAGDDLRRHKAKMVRDAAHRHQILRGITRDETLDNTPINDTYFSELFEAAHSFEHNPHTTENYSIALQAVQRLFTYCEQQARHEDGDNFGQRYYMIILEKLASELS